MTADVEQLHIASLVVHSTPGRVARVAAAIADVPGACVHAASANGKLVVTIETGSAEAMTACVGAIQHLDGVLSAALVYQCADSLDAMNEEIFDAQA
jgi:nitrate reductase NapD